MVGEKDARLVRNGMSVRLYHKEEIMSDNPDDAILKIMAKAALGIIIAPFVYAALKVVELAQWISAKGMRK